MNKGITRTMLAFFLLHLILLASINLTLFQIDINLAFLLIVITSCIVLTTQNHKFYRTLIILFIAYSYTGSRLWEIVNPIWFFIPRTLLYGLVFSFISILFGRNIIERFLVSCLTVSLGEIIYVVIVQQIGWKESLGNSELMNLLLLQAGVIFTFYVIREIKIKLEVILQQIEQQKKRWTNE